MYETDIPTPLPFHPFSFPLLFFPCKMGVRSLSSLSKHTKNLNTSKHLGSWELGVSGPSSLSPTPTPTMPNSNSISFPLYFLLLFLHFLPTSSSLRSDDLNPNPNPNPNPDPDRNLNPNPARTPTSIFLLAGQSNMAGRGGVTTSGTHQSWDHIVPPECRPSPAVLRLDAKLRWVEAAEPLHADIDTNHTCGVGPGMPFANALIAGDAAAVGVVGLVPCAVGGTGIEEWERGGWLYRRLLRRARAAVRESGGGGSLQGLLWYQGERDAMLKGGAEEYGERLERFFGDLRDDLEAPMLPIIQVAIASGEGPYIQIVRQAQLGIDLLNLKTVDAMGLQLEPDKLHLTTSSQVILGQKLADTFLQFLPKQTQAVLPSQRQQTNIANNILLHNLFHTFLLLFSITMLLL